MMVINLPFSLWSTFRLEARFGFNRMTPGALSSPTCAKSLVLSVLLGGLLVIGAILLMDRGGKWWWLYAWARVDGVLAADHLGVSRDSSRRCSTSSRRYRMRRLKARVEGLLERCGFASKGVFVMDGSRRSAHGNAYFTGVGRNKRIVFFDTLLERLGGLEVEAVLAHELGHFRLQHAEAAAGVVAVRFAVGVSR